MNLTLLPSATPRLTVRSLAKIMTLPAYAQTAELRAQKYPRAGASRQRVPYYQPAMSALREYLASQADVLVLERAMADLEAELRAAESEEPPPHDNTLNKLRNNLRTLADIAKFARLREVHRATAGSTLRLLLNGVEIRSTPDLELQTSEAKKFVFIHFAEDHIDVDEARRTLELAHWVASECADGAVAMAQFEFWLLASNEVLSWPMSRKRTVSRARQTLPIIAGAWEAVAPPGAKSDDNKAEELP